MYRISQNSDFPYEIKHLFLIGSTLYHTSELLKLFEYRKPECFFFITKYNSNVNLFQNQMWNFILVKSIFRSLFFF